MSISSLYNVRNTRLHELGEGVRGEEQGVRGEEEQGVGGGEHGGEQQAAKSTSVRSCELIPARSSTVHMCSRLGVPTRSSKCIAMILIVNLSTATIFAFFA